MLRALTAKQKGTIIAAIIAAASVIVGGGVALPANDNRDDAWKAKIIDLEKSQIKDSINIEIIKGDTKYIRERMDALLQRKD